MKARDISVEAGFGFFAIAALSLYFGGGAAGFLAAAAVHEAGHMAAMLLLTDCGMEIRLTAAGIYIYPSYSRPPSRLCEAAILVAGPSAGLIAAFLINDGYPEFFEAGLAMSAVNLLPIRGADGGSLLRLAPVFDGREEAAGAIGGAALFLLAASSLLPLCSGDGVRWLWLAAAALLWLRGFTEKG